MKVLLIYINVLILAVWLFFFLEGDIMKGWLLLGLALIVLAFGAILDELEERWR